MLQLQFSQRKRGSKDSEINFLFCKCLAKILASALAPATIHLATWTEEGFPSPADLGIKNSPLRKTVRRMKWPHFLTHSNSQVPRLYSLFIPGPKIGKQINKRGDLFVLYINTHQALNARIKKTSKNCSLYVLMQQTL